MEKLSLNLLFEIFGYAPSTLVTYGSLNSANRSRLEKQVDHLQTLLEEVLGNRNIRNHDYQQCISLLKPRNKLYFLNHKKTDIRIYDIQTNTLEIKECTLENQEWEKEIGWGMRAAYWLYDEETLIYTGGKYNNEVQPYSFKVKIKTGLVEKLADMENAKFRHAIIKANQNVFTFGGLRDEGDNSLTAIECYNDIAWETVANLLYSRTWVGCTLHEELIYIAGHPADGIIQTFNPGTFQVHQSDFTFEHTNYGCSLLSVNSDLLIFQWKSIWSIQKNCQVKEMPAKVYWTSYFPVRYQNFVYLPRFEEIYRVNLDDWEVELIPWQECP